MSIDVAIEAISKFQDTGLRSACLFPVIEPTLRSLTASEAWNPHGLMATALRQIKQALPDMIIMADVALDPYTSHGHDGLADANGTILNDETVACLVKMALTQADSGVDFIAPSDMMDGRVIALRQALDENGFHHVGIVAYSAKYASALYGPFRDALDVRLGFGDKRSYQMNPANVREALLEAKLDEQEGADILLVKPALPYLDVIARLRAQTLKPIAAYHVSGEYAMVMAAHANGWLDAREVFAEMLLSIRRAGADLIFSYTPYAMYTARD
jgi:porphobilinogen synthase